ncbi:MAG: Phenylalanine-tRNA ligase beta subunit [Berkelbacteria bacterium GW2011_GWA2_35_9]|uniref:phenylalanine--tRNA ligase n=1 Tax=Berkelbacteria bacterium GW2011_GWA2_35_9 TaxID=1618333 RepID=A0A0G0FP68_9BACT|nr:MAG: Phenylalanine-tRNA ligase beta subunit [Berkelbacteria bacterium GW2011_GWA2_35_9]
MLAPFDWLNEFVDFPNDLNMIETAFSELGFEVENINNEFVEIEVTPNRADMLSIIGIARELAIKFPSQIKSKNNSLPKFQTTSKLINFDIEAKDEVINFAGLVVKDIKITASPEYIQKRIIACGLKPINNFVDLTNYLMLETGQPLHSFDLDSIKYQLKLRKSQEKEKIVLLDNSSIELKQDLLIYESGNKIVDLIGVMGGKNSATTDKTKNIFVQTSIFNPDIIRLASKSSKITTPASYRYERGVDENLTKITLAKFKQIIEENKWGRVEELFYQDINLSAKSKIKLDYKKVSQLIGTNFDKQFCNNALQSVGCQITDDEVVPPSYRKDITIWQDLAEEIARVYGYNNLKVKVIDKPTEIVDNDQYWKKYQLKKSLTDLGFNEVSTYSFLSENETKIFNQNDNQLVTIKNPLSNEHQSLRNSLVPLLIKTASKNPWYSNIKLFEIGNVFYQDNEIENLAILSHQKLNIDGEIKISPHDKNYSIFKIRKSLFVYETPLDKAFDLFKLKNKITLSELELKPIKFKSFSKFHPTILDISIVVNKNIYFEKIKYTLHSNIQAIFDIDLFDKFENKNFGENKISYAFHLIFDIQDINKINDAYQKTLIMLKNNFEAIIR